MEDKLPEKSRQGMQKQLIYNAIFLMVLCLLFNACSNTPYRATSADGLHYKAIKISTQHYLVTVTSDNHGMSTVEAHALFKAANLCLHHNYDWFEVITQETETKRKRVIIRQEIWIDKGVRPDSDRAYSARDLVDTIVE